MTGSFDHDGFEIVPSVLSATDVDALRSILSSLKVSPGHRQLMDLVPEIAALATSTRILGLLERFTRAKPFPVRSIFFDKTASTNWLVPWHQDLSIAVREKREYANYGPWSVKEGVPHVQPPAEILGGMITLRLHLDDCDESNGALRVIPGSHQLGRLSAARIAEIRSEHKEIVCSVQAGDALMMRPLILHASSEAILPTHRRVIHLEYATSPLADGLEWAETDRPAFPSR